MLLMVSITLNTFGSLLFQGVAGKQNGIAQLMQLRRAANHPLLLRTHYSDDKVRELARSLIRLPEYSKISLPKLQEELLKFSDFQLHQTLSLGPVSLPQTQRYCHCHFHYMFQIDNVLFPVSCCQNTA